MPTLPRRLVGRAIAARLASVTHATGWYGQIGAMYGLPGVEDTPDAPPRKSDDDTRVQPYFVLFPGVGGPTGEFDVGDSVLDLAETIQVTAAGGDVDDVLALVERIDAALYRWEPVLELPDGSDPVQCGPLRPPPGYDPPLLTDRDVTPFRFYVPMQYQFAVFT